MNGLRYCWTQARALAAETLLRAAYSWMPPSERTPLALALHQYWSEKLAEFEAGKAGESPPASGPDSGLPLTTGRSEPKGAAHSERRAMAALREIPKDKRDAILAWIRFLEMKGNIRG